MFSPGSGADERGDGRGRWWEHQQRHFRWAVLCCCQGSIFFILFLEANCIFNFLPKISILFDWESEPLHLTKNSTCNLNSCICYNVAPCYVVCSSVTRWRYCEHQESLSLCHSAVALVSQTAGAFPWQRSPTIQAEKCSGAKNHVSTKRHC